MKKYKRLLGYLFALSLVTGCANTPKDYTNFRESNPKSILILPPINNTVDVKATYGLYSSTQSPLAESGFYVMPVAVVDEIFKKNGIYTANDAQAISIKKLNEIFGADAALYITITQYGSKYLVVSSSSIVTAKAKMVYLKTGKVLWEGEASASSDEGQTGDGGLAVILISALVKQIVSSIVDTSYEVAKTTNYRLLSANSHNGILYGPRHPLYQKK